MGDYKTASHALLPLPLWGLMLTVPLQETQYALGDQLLSHNESRGWKDDAAYRGGETSSVLRNLLVAIAHKDPNRNIRDVICG